jgi:hypothetical protein
MEGLDMKVWTWLGLMTLVMASAACGNDRTSTGDAGGDGGITLMDSGSGGDSSTTTDTGTSGTCPPQTIPAPTTSPCSPAFVTCIRACAMTDDACFAACVDAQPPECPACFDQGILSCATMDPACAQSAGDLDCCASDAGCAATDSACIMTNCATELDAINACYNAAAADEACGPAIVSCVAAM